MNAIEKQISEEDFEQELNDSYPTVTICGMAFDQGTALKELDPVAFRCAHADSPISYECYICEAEHETEQDGNDCCMEFVCGSCGNIQDTEEEAEACCD